MSRGFESGWDVYAKGNGPQLYEEMYWRPGHSPLGDKTGFGEADEAWVPLPLSKWSISDMPTLTPIAILSFSTAKQMSDAIEASLRWKAMPAGLHWNPRSGRFVVAIARAKPVENGGVKSPPELVRRLAVLDKLLADGIINQAEHDERKAELIDIYT